jgi:hypothetical protein
MNMRRFLTLIAQKENLWRPTRKTVGMLPSQPFYATKTLEVNWELLFSGLTRFATRAAWKNGWHLPPAIGS